MDATKRDRDAALDTFLATLNARQARMPDGEYERWICLTCEGEPLFDLGDFLTHLHVTHCLPFKTPGLPAMICHGDGVEYFNYIHTWDFAGVKAEQYTQFKRSGEDAAYWTAMVDEEL